RVRQGVHGHVPAGCAARPETARGARPRSRDAEAPDDRDWCAVLAARSSQYGRLQGAVIPDESQLGSMLLAPLAQGCPGNRNGCKAMIPAQPESIPCRGWPRPPTSAVRRLSLSQDVGARGKPGQGAFGSKIRCKMLAQ